MLLLVPNLEQQMSVHAAVVHKGRIAQREWEQTLYWRASQCRKASTMYHNIYN
ncbi:UNVERIFIED_CONTAM: hypothetical protein FKN15_040222 [Acipenser sinensis]